MKRLPVLIVVALIVIAMGLFAACGSSTSDEPRNARPPTTSPLEIDHSVEHVNVNGHDETFVCFQPRYGSNALSCDRVEQP